MHMIGLDVHRSNGPGMVSTDAANLLFDERSDLANENLFAVFWAPDIVVAELVGDMFGVLRIHTPIITGVLSLWRSRRGGLTPP